MAGVWTPGRSVARLSVPDDTHAGMCPGPASSASLALCPAPCPSAGGRSTGSILGRAKKGQRLLWLLLTAALPPNTSPLPPGVGRDSGPLVHRQREPFYKEFGGPETERSEERRILSSPTRLACPPPSNLGRYRGERQPAQSTPLPGPQLGTRVGLPPEQLLGHSSRSPDGGWLYWAPGGRRPLGLGFK